MSINDKMTGLANAVREKSGYSEKMGVADMTEALKNIQLFHFETVGGTIEESHSNVTISAPKVAGYTFAFWLNPASIGDVRFSYIDLPTNPETNIWTQQLTKPCWFQAVAIYVLNGFSKLGGVINCVLSTFKQILTPQLGGVSYAA